MILLKAKLFEWNKNPKVYNFYTKFIFFMLELLLPSTSLILAQSTQTILYCLSYFYHIFSIFPWQYEITKYSSFYHSHLFYFWKIRYFSFIESKWLNKILVCVSEIFKSDLDFWSVCVFFLDVCEGIFISMYVFWSVF